MVWAYALGKGFPPPVHGWRAPEETDPTQDRVLEGIRVRPSQAVPPKMPPQRPKQPSKPPPVALLAQTAPKPVRIAPRVQPAARPVVPVWLSFMRETGKVLLPWKGTGKGNLRTPAPAPQKVAPPQQQAVVINGNVRQPPPLPREAMPPARPMPRSATLRMSAAAPPPATHPSQFTPHQQSPVAMAPASGAAADVRGSREEQSGSAVDPSSVAPTTPPRRPGFYLKFLESRGGEDIAPCRLDNDPVRAEEPAQEASPVEPKAMPYKVSPQKPVMGCRGQQSEAEDEQGRPGDSLGSDAEAHSGTQHWICPVCDEPNRLSRTQCNNCGAYPPAAKAEGHVALEHAAVPPSNTEDPFFWVNQRLVGKFMSSPEDKKRQWHEVEDTGPGQWLCQTWTNGARDKPKLTRIRFDAGRILWGLGEVKLHIDSLRENRLVWVNDSKGTTWEWVSGWRDTW